jgi:hypothetical protein
MLQPRIWPKYPKSGFPGYGTKSTQTPDPGPWAPIAGYRPFIEDLGLIWPISLVYGPISSINGLFVLWTAMDPPGCPPPAAPPPAAPPAGLEAEWGFPLTQPMDPWPGVPKVVILALPPETRVFGLRAAAFTKSHVYRPFFGQKGPKTWYLGLLGDPSQGVISLRIHAL